MPGSRELSSNVKVEQDLQARFAWLQALVQRKVEVLFFAILLVRGSESSLGLFRLMEVVAFYYVGVRNSRVVEFRVVEVVSF